MDSSRPTRTSTRAECGTGFSCSRTPWRNPSFTTIWTGGCCPPRRIVVARGRPEAGGGAAAGRCSYRSGHPWPGPADTATVAFEAGKFGLIGAGRHGLVLRVEVETTQVLRGQPVKEFLRTFPHFKP